MVYQPIHRLADGRPVGVEALARFPDQDKRTPDRWFAEAAQVGLGTELEMLAVRQAIRGLPVHPCRALCRASTSRRRPLWRRSWDRRSPPRPPAGWSSR